MSYAVEIYNPGSDGLAFDTARLESAARARAAGGVAIRYLGSVALPGDEMVFHLFDAGSRDLVDDLLRGLGLVAERVVEAVTTGSTEQRSPWTREG
jgi:hypothetical protein